MKIFQRLLLVILLLSLLSVHCFDVFDNPDVLKLKHKFEEYTTTFKLHVNQQLEAIKYSTKSY
jgi:hypothetical protein